MDAGIDGKIRYSIADERIGVIGIFSVTKYFQINSETGEISLIQTLSQNKHMNTVYRIIAIASSGYKAHELSSHSLIYFEVYLSAYN